MKRITEAAVHNYWLRVISAHPASYIECGEFKITKMGEDAADHFDCMTDDGQSDIEKDIFDWAVLFSDQHTASEFL